MRDFREILYRGFDAGKHVCIGLDTDRTKLPFSAIGPSYAAQTMFNIGIVEATCDIVCAYKPNFGFYTGSGGAQSLRETIRRGKEIAPDALWILDAKRLDIGNTNAGYVEEAFEYFGADAITIHNYMGKEAAQPFLDRSDKLIFVLCRTSNPGAGEFQDLVIERTGMRKLYEVVARNVNMEWNANGNCGLVVGATAPLQIERVREHAPLLPLLIPGIGAQGGDLESTVQAASHGFIINASRSIIFASAKADGYAQAARAETIRLHESILLAL